MKTDDLVFFVYVPVVVKTKNGRLTYGDIPTGRLNPETNQWETVVNNRGAAYAARGRQMYRRK